MRAQPTFREPLGAQPTFGGPMPGEPTFGVPMPNQAAPDALVPSGADSQILAAERALAERRRKNGLTAYLGIVSGVLLLFALPTFLVEVWIGLIVVVAVLLSIGLGIGLMMIIGKSQGVLSGPASTGPLAFGQIHTQLPAEQVWAALRQAGQANGLTWRQLSPTTAQLENSTNWISWGNRFLVDLRPSADQPGAGVVTVQAEPKFAATYHDYGRNQAVVNSLLLAVPGRALPPYVPQDRFTSQ